MVYDCIIIGAGASGLFCGAAAMQRINGLILEKTGHAGTKLLMSGNGHCNITHSGSIKDFIPCYGKNGAKIRKCLYKYNNISLISFLEDNGIRVLTRNDGKVFPKSMDANDILDMLMRRSGDNGFDIKYKTPVDRIKASDSGWQVMSGGNDFTARNLVIASGGCSYPFTGSDGSMFHVLERDLHIDISCLRPALSSVCVANYPYSHLSGISFENVMISVSGNGGKHAENRGGLIFTHSDLSGPAVMDISKYISPGDTISINYLYPLDNVKVLEILKNSVKKRRTSTSNTISSEFGLPKRLCRSMVERYGESLKKLADKLTCESFIVSSVSGFDKAMVTSGGIDISQLDLSSMEFKDHPGLFAIGEALDIDGMTGGYNLQLAYSSARTAIAHIH